MMAIDGRELCAKDDANISFDRANFEKAQDERDKARGAEPPQPTLTPDGDLRKSTDQKVREKQDAIKAKMREDRARSMSHER